MLNERHHRFVSSKLFYIFNKIINNIKNSFLSLKKTNNYLYLSLIYTNRYLK